MRPIEHANLKGPEPRRGGRIALAPAVWALALHLGAPAAGLGGAAVWVASATAQENAPAAQEQPASGAEAAKKRRRARKPAEAAPAPKSPEAAAPPTAADAGDPLVEQLSKAGVKGCLAGMSAMAKQTLGGVVSYGRAANWQTSAPNQRLASLILGQSYPQGAPLPKGLSIMLGAPAGPAKCDTYGVQVIPTKDKCADLQTKITVRGKKLGDISGIPFLNDVNKSQIMLLPSAGDGCVLVALRIVYSE